MISILRTPLRSLPFKRPLKAGSSFDLRFFSSTDDVAPTFDVDTLSHKFLATAPKMAEALSSEGYFTTTNFLNASDIQLLRDQSISLRNQGRFEPSWSEKIGADGQVQRFDKEGVYACEPDGQDYYTAPDLVIYMSSLLTALPSALNDQAVVADMDLSNQAFNAKLAVTSPGGSVYPMHIDNPEGLAAGDTRKLTCILYLNPNYEPKDGGELQIVLKDNATIELTPQGGRLVAFWSDEIPHQVLPTAPDADASDASLDRYALTVWIPTGNMTAIHNPQSKFHSLMGATFK